MSNTKRESLEIFDYLGRFGIGHETTNRIDNILIFGSEDGALRKYFDVLIEPDTFYGSTEHFRAAQREYIETPGRSDRGSSCFCRDAGPMQRRGLFFKIPDELARGIEIMGSLGLYEAPVNTLRKWPSR